MKLILVTLASLLAFSAQAKNIAQKDLPAKVKALHAAIDVAGYECHTDMDAEEHDLGKNSMLYIVPCYSGAYQTSSKLYLSGEHETKQVTVLSWNSEVNKVDTSSDFTNVYYDSKSKVISTFAKARGIGDCGQTSQTTVNVGEYGMVSFITTEIRHKDCPVYADDEDVDLADEWPVVFKQ